MFFSFPVISWIYIDIREQYDIIVYGMASDKDVSVSLSYWTTILSDWQASNVASTLAKALRSVLTGIKEDVNQLDLFSDRNRNQLSSWNSGSPEKIDMCVYQIIEQQVLAQPSAPAVCAWDAEFSYSKLDDLSARLAQHLVVLGVGPEVLVPICFEKSAWTIVAMLGIIRAGGAFIPLDPAHPLQRLKDLVKQLGSEILLISPYALQTSGLEMKLTVEVSPEMVYGLPTCSTNLAARITPQQIMYILFTSGSTGEPKGVVMEHSAVSTSITGHGRAMNFQPDSRVLQFASYGFDASIAEIFTTLIYGGCICVPSDSERLDNTVLAMNRMKVNWAFFTPSFIRLIKPEDVPTLKTLVLGGEAMRKENISTWGDRVQLMNGYGPTETCVFCLTREIVSSTDRAEKVGCAVSSVSWVVDPVDHERLLPVGCVGELLVEGPSLARGYLNDKQKTEAVFVKNPAWACDDKAGRDRRMYKTGDLVRYGADGMLEYLGRKDTQVKLHGQRLEMGEIEHHVLADDEVFNAMMMVPTKGHCQERLVAVVSLEDTSQESALGPGFNMQKTTGVELNLVDAARMDRAALQILRMRERLSIQMPTYMIPALWIVVKGIPLSSSGKLDRAYVARWVENISNETYRKIVDIKKEKTGGPTTLMERRLQEMIGRVLNIASEVVYLNRSFLSLGGDSITAMQLVSRGRAEGISLKVQEIMQSQTIAMLALMARQSGHSMVSRADDVDTAFELSPIQRMCFEMASQKENHFNQSFFLRFTREVQAQDVSGAIEALIRQHSMLRARFVQAEDGQWSQLITKNVGQSHHFTVYEMENRDQIPAVVGASQIGLDIENGPLFLADMFNVDGDGQMLFLVAHHLVIDLVSWRVIIQDLEELLVSRALSSEKPFPFQAWCKMQSEYALKHLMPSKVLPANVLPADYEYWGMTGKPNLYADTVSLSFTISEDISSKLFGHCQDALRTEPVEIFLATLLHAFSQTFGDRATPTVFSEGHGREPWNTEVDLSGTVGWFTTMSPLYIPVESGTDVVDTVRHTKDIRRSLPGNGWPYFASRFLNTEGMKTFKDHWPMELLFNYLGRYQQLERDDGLLRQEPLPINSGELVSDVGLDVQRLALFEVNVAVLHGSAQFSVVYNRHIQRGTDVGRWMLSWEQSLLEAAKQLSDMEPERTLSDFPLLSLSYAGLDKLKNERLKQVGVQSFAEVEDVYPCSPMQQGLLLSQTKSSGAYEVEFMFEVVQSKAGVSVDMARLLSAWQQVVDRHAALRTVFVDSVSKDGLFDQIVLNRVDTSTILKSCGEAGDEAVTALKERQPMDHGNHRPPHRLTVCQTSLGRVFYKLEINHVIIDAASMALIQRDLALAYDGALSTSPRPLYSDYIKYLCERPVHIAIDFWKGQLALVEPCHFPLVQSAHKETKCLRYMDVKLEMEIGALQVFCDKNSVTVPSVMQAVWGLVLRCYTGSDQICFGYLASGRDVAVEGIEETVGPFINMLICHMNMTANSRIGELVKNVQADYLAGLEHQHCSLAQIQHALDLAGQPLFNTMMSVQKTSSSSNIPDGDSGTPTLSFENIGSHDPTEVSDTNCNIADQNHADFCDSMILR